MFKPLHLRRTDLWPGNYRTGMWIWALQRIAGLILVLYLFAHIIVISLVAVSSEAQGKNAFDAVMGFFGHPVVLVLELLLIWAVLFHAFNGIRVILFDLGIGIKYQKLIFWFLMIPALGIWIAAIILLAPKISGSA